MEQTKGLSDKFFKQVDAMSEEDFLAMYHAIEKRKMREGIVFLSENITKVTQSAKDDIATLIKTRQNIANDTTLTIKKRKSGVQVVNKKLKEKGFDFNNNDLPPPPTEINQVV